MKKQNRRTQAWVWVAATALAGVLCLLAVWLVWRFAAQPEESLGVAIEGDLDGIGGTLTADAGADGGKIDGDVVSGEAAGQAGGDVASGEASGEADGLTDGDAAAGEAIGETDGQPDGGAAAGEANGEADGLTDGDAAAGEAAGENDGQPDGGAAAGEANGQPNGDAPAAGEAAGETNGQSTGDASTGEGAGEQAVASSSASQGVSQTVQDILAGMTLRDKVCQMMFVTPSAITGVSKVTSAGETTRAALEKYPVGGLDYNKTNMVSQSQVAEMLSNVQSFSKIPLLLACDEEGGRVARLMNTIGTTWVDAMLDYKDDGPETAYANAYTMAHDMSTLGFNMDLAPVADVWSNPKNTVIGDRAYSDDFEQAASLLPSAVKGFQEGGVACVIKHFPGHGDSSADSHYGSVYIDKTLDQLRSQELLPFQAAIDAGADSVMMGHLIIRDVSEEPAVFSYELVTTLLREEMGFQGVVMTDALAMKAISDHYTNAQVAVDSVKAGVDMLLCPMDLDASIDALLSAVESGEIEESRIDESVVRILTLKENRGILP